MLERGRAKNAYDAVYSVTEGKIKEYRSHVKQMPMLIKTNGLAQALLFARTKKEKKIIYKHINDWLLLESNLEKFNLSKEQKEIIDIVIKTDSSTYRLITTEVMAYIEWLKRFAEGREVGEIGG